MQLQDIFKLTKLESLKALQLYAMQLVNSMQVGNHQSAKRGSGIEFKEYKNYAIGDSLKQLDWKYYARTDHYMIKEAEVERLQEFLFVLDQSYSMKLEGNKLSKFNCGKAIVASLAYIADRQHDQYNLFNSTPIFSDYTEFVYQILELACKQDFAVADMVPNHQPDKKSTLFLITDGYYSISDLTEILKKWTYAADQVVFIHLLFEYEIKLSFEKQQFRFQDLETGEMVEVNTKDQLVAYQERLNNWHEELKACCARQHASYHHYDGSQPFNVFMMQLVHSLKQST